jgi:DEAD/DEAH box helicase domain-containing protein
MLPLQQAYEVRAALLEYIKATFHFKDTEVGKAFYRFVEDERNGLFKGPYVSLKTPFVKPGRMRRFRLTSSRTSNRINIR